MSDQTPSDTDFTANTPNAGALSGSKIKFFGILVVAFVSILAVIFYNYQAQQQEESFESQLQQKTEIVVEERADIILTWLSGLVGQSRSVVQADLFRLFASEIAMADGDVSAVMAPDGVTGEGEQSYRDQIPYMVRAISDLVKDTDYTAAYMIDSKGQTFLTSLGAKDLSEEQRAFAQTVFQSGRILYAPVRAVGSNLEFDLIVPIFPSQFMQQDEASVIGAFIFTVDVAQGLHTLLQPNPISGLQGRYRLFQMHDRDTIEEVRPLNPDAITVSNFPVDLFAERNMGFAVRPSVDHGVTVYSFASRIEPARWMLVWETPYDEVRAALAENLRNLMLLALFFVASIVAAFGAFWWRTNSDHNRDLATQYADFAKKISSQKKLLDSINNNIQEFIGLKNEDGRYSYVNPSFAKAVGQDVEDLIGANDEKIFGHGTSVRLKKLDQMAFSTQKPVQVIDEIYLKGEKRHLQISKVPLDSGVVEDSKGKAIVTVAHDITDLVNEQQKREQSIKQTVSALVRAVELRDPHLGGHSRRVAELAVLVAQDMSVDDRVRRAVEIAANLSQIGKLDIPKELLVSERRLTDDEIKIMQQHIFNAEKIISEIDFDVPVLPAISQMYERLDGSGYPRGLKDDDIGIEGRILGACDYLVARIEPRSYRAGITPEEALTYLEQSSSRYDPKVVQSLKYVVHSTMGEKIIASIRGA